jgi:hypothetical protein
MLPRATITAPNVSQGQLKGPFINYYISPGNSRVNKAITA